MSAASCGRKPERSRSPRHSVTTTGSHVWRRGAATLVLAVTLVGCEKGFQMVPLVTGVPDPMKGLNGSIGCFTNSASGPLVTDPIYGTAIIDGDTHATSPALVAWRPGFTARRVGSE